MKNRNSFQFILTILTLAIFTFTACNKEYHELPETETATEFTSTYNGNPSDGSASSRSGCPQGNVILTSQTDINNFAQLYSNCSVISGDLKIQEGVNEEITSLEPLGFLLEIAGELDVDGTGTFGNLYGLHNITLVGGDLVIKNNFDIIDLTGNGYQFALKEIGGNLIIDNNDALINLSGLESLESIGGSFEVTNNAEIEALSFSTESIDWVRIFTNVKIQGNPQLSTCAIEDICEFLDNGGQATISNNAQGCNSIVQVKAECAGTMDCGTFTPRTWVSNRQQHSVKINWDTVNDADLYKVRYRKKNSNNVWKVKPSSGSNLTLNALQSNTNYEYQHKYQCASGWSSWGNLKFFKTKV